MKEKFKLIPYPLQRQILIRLGGAGLGLLMLTLVLAYRGDWRFFIPCIALTGVCAGSALLLYLQCIDDRYVIIEGICTEIEKSPLRRRVKAIYIRTAEHDVKLLNARRIKNLSVGNQLMVYVNEKTAVYEMDGCKVLCSYLALAKGGHRT